MRLLITIAVLAATAQAAIIMDAIVGLSRDSPRYDATISGTGEVCLHDTTGSVRCTEFRDGKFYDGTDITAPLWSYESGAIIGETR